MSKFVLGFKTVYTHEWSTSMNNLVSRMSRVLNENSDLLLLNCLVIQYVKEKNNSFIKKVIHVIKVRGAIS